MKLRQVGTLTVLLTTALLTSCVKPISSNVYSTRQVGEVSTTYSGIVKNVREIVVEKSDTGAGTFGGAAVGGIAGSAIGRGGFLPMAAGALVGAVGGNLIEGKLNKQTALEYIIELNDGKLLTVVQGADSIYDVGQPVYVIVSQAGRSRITAQ